jgi:hypothetical protein
MMRSSAAPPHSLANTAPHDEHSFVRHETAPSCCHIRCYAYCARAIPSIKLFVDCYISSESSMISRFGHRVGVSTSEIPTYPIWALMILSDCTASPRQLESLDMATNNLQGCVGHSTLSTRRTVITGYSYMAGYVTDRGNGMKKAALLPWICEVLAFSQGRPITRPIHGRSPCMTRFFQAMRG